MTTAPRRSGARHADDGFVLPYVMLVLFLIMTGTATMLGVVANNIPAARHSQDVETALAAAQAGIQAYVAQLNADCAYTAANGACTAVASLGGTLTTGSYAVTVLNPQALTHRTDDVRLVSTGTANGTKVALLADVSGTPDVLRFAYVSNHETTDPSFLASYFPPRTIPITTAGTLAVFGISLPAGSTTATLSWNGLTPTSAAACGAIWYDSPAGTGRATIGDDVPESGSLLPAVAGVSPSIDHPCSVAFGAGMVYDGPVYSHDALYFANGVNTATGPDFGVPDPCGGTVTTGCEPLPPASTAWSAADAPAAPASPWRSFPAPLGGAPVDAASVQSSYFDVTLPGSATDAEPGATCSYAGDVSITVSGSTASVSGPGTASQPASCRSVAIGTTSLYVAGDATLAPGNLSGGQLSIVTSGDIVLTGSLTTTATTSTNQYGEPSVTAGQPALDLVAQGSVRMQHAVDCADGSTPDAITGYCPNDTSGLFPTDRSAAVVNSDGTLKTTHPARAYCNTDADVYPCSGGTSSGCDSSSANVTVDAAVFALTGSLRTDNFNRGCALGTLTVNGGVYADFHGPLGQEWQVPSSGASLRSYSGYRLQVNYTSLEFAGLPYVPKLVGGDVAHPWQVLAVSGTTGGGS